MKKLRIILGSIIIIGGIGGITSGDIIPAIFCILCGISLIPAIYEKSKLKDKKLVQIIIPIILFSICGMTLQKENVKTNYPQNETYTNTNIEEKIEKEKKLEEERIQREAEEAAAAEQAKKLAEEQERKKEEAAAAEQARQQAQRQAQQQQTIKKQTNQSTTTQNTNNSRTVYRTPTGKRYHYISTCGGKNSTATTLSQAIASGLTPCQKCAQ